MVTMANELCANDAPQEIIINAAAVTEEEKEAAAIRSEKCLQIRRCIAILGFTQGETDAESSTELSSAFTTFISHAIVVVLFLNIDPGLRFLPVTS